MNKIIILLAFLFTLTLSSAVTIENQTVMQETGTNGAYIRVEQDTVVDQLEVSEVYGGIIFTNLATFNSTYTNLDVSNPSKIEFLLMDDVTVYYGNGTITSISGTDFTLELEIPGNSYITLQNDVPIAPASASIIIKPDLEDTVPHIILGRNLIFQWVIVLLFQ